MITHNQTFAGLKSSCVITQCMSLGAYSIDKQADAVVYHSMKMDLKPQQQNQLFSKVLAFLKKFLTDKIQQTDIRKHLSKYGKSEGRLNQSTNEKQLSFKKMNFGSKICFDAQTMSKQDAEWQETKGRARGNNKKISIFVMEEEYPQAQSGSDEILSESIVRTIRSIEIPQVQLNLQTIALIFQTPQPFLINLSICLFLRYCLSTRCRVKLEDGAWVLCVATVIAYKLYYDEYIIGLLGFFNQVMDITTKDLIDLERCFLQEIDYNTVIRNYDYYYVLGRLSAVQLSI